MLRMLTVPCNAFLTLFGKARYSPVTTCVRAHGFREEFPLSGLNRKFHNFTLLVSLYIWLFSL